MDEKEEMYTISSDFFTLALSTTPDVPLSFPERKQLSEDETWEQEEKKKISEDP
jgi:hypothetical protein